MSYVHRMHHANCEYIDDNNHDSNNYVKWTNFRYMEVNCYENILVVLCERRVYDIQVIQDQILVWFPYATSFY